MQTVSFEHMVDGTPEDYDLIGRELAAHKADQLTDHILGTLKAMAGPLLGYQVDRFQHCLQSATRALRNGEDDEMVVAALLHDVGDPIAPENHSAVAADILRPYVSDRTHWIIRHHGLFQGYYYFHHLGADRDAREAFRDHEWFDDCAAFCEEYDQNCFERNHDTIALEEFEPMVRDLFSRDSRFPLPHTTLV
ncbi:MAG: HD domain-containing protein [Actinomycetota bacterium]|nr:HD domain-containing protein [Actinomycetota bacterium]MEC9467517.1 HD domain-containing protein [Actinomycetota bacterium]MED5232539.1 HD domain-containing protein [Actinomycetota bacterium]